MTKEELQPLIESREVVKVIDFFGTPEGEGYVMHLFEDVVQIYMLTGQHALSLITVPYKLVVKKNA